MSSSSDMTPGLTGPLEFYTSCGDSTEWMHYEDIKYYTIAFVFDEDKILLGHKKRNFGKGVCSGFGGKVEPGETTLQAALRELEEESGITAPLEHAGTFLSYTKGTPFALHIDIFRAESYSGTVVETDEMHPEWFSTAAIPYDKMWGSERYWLPLVMQKLMFSGRGDFMKEEEGYRLCRWWCGIPPASELRRSR